MPLEFHEGPSARFTTRRLADRLAQTAGDEHTLAFPSYDGTDMFLSLGNLIANPAVGMLSADFRCGSLRLNGTATIDADDPLLAEFPGARAMAGAHRVSRRRKNVHLPHRNTTGTGVPHQTGQARSMRRGSRPRFVPTRITPIAPTQL